MKIIKLGPAYVGTLKITGEVGGYCAYGKDRLEVGGYYAYGKDRREVIDKLISLYYQTKIKL